MEELLNMPIKGLQIMLRTIAYALGTIPIVNPDGIFDGPTEQSVRAFQREYGIPVTGVVDETTFTAVVRVYGIAQELMDEAQSPVIHFPAALLIRPGQSHPHIFLVQAMFSALHRVFPEFESLSLTGILDTATENDLRLLQSQAGLEVTGILDNPTWNRLNLLYRVLFDREFLPAQG